ncbi:hypothetical protein V3H18_02090 [Methylocystis sp. 9N]|uniref:Transcription factor n=1 Tax=Methylocystis borbori TaxID=3118750 RepID=A0ABU7XFI7_9HYPH
MVRQLNIRSDEGYEIAQRLGKTTTDVVLSALREYQAQQRGASACMTAPEAETNYRTLMKAVAAAHAKAPAKILTDEEMYDEFGLPK